MARADAEQRLNRQQRLLSYAVAGAVAGMLVLIGAVLYVFIFEQDAAPRWNPLGDYPTQTVVNPDKLAAPGETVDVTGKKCVTADEPVTVLGQSEWRAVAPPGASVQLGSGQTIRYPAGATVPDGVPQPDADGCTTFHYHNAIPAIVAAQAQINCQATGVPSTWKITGRDTPVRPNGDRGAPRVWESETFRLGC